MKYNLNLYSSISAKMLILFISLMNFKSTFLIAEDAFLNEIEINNSTKLETNTSDLPTNPFEIVDMYRRANSMNDATEPSDAIDDALKLFNKTEEKESL